MGNNEYKKKNINIRLDENTKENFEIWKLPLRYKEGSLNKGTAYSLMLNYTYNEIIKENDFHIDGKDDGELMALANVLLLMERKGIREWIFKRSCINDYYQVVEVFYKYYRYVVRDVLNLHWLTNDHIYSTIYPSYKDYIEKFNVINESMKIVDESMYRLLMIISNVYLMEKLDKMTDEEKNQKI